MFSIDYEYSYEIRMLRLLISNICPTAMRNDEAHATVQTKFIRFLKHFEFTQQNIKEISPQSTIKNTIDLKPNQTTHSENIFNHNRQYSIWIRSKENLY